MTEKQPGTVVFDAQEYAEFMRLKRTLNTDNVYRLTSESPKEVKKAPRTTLDILGRPVTWLIDTVTYTNPLEHKRKPDLLRRNIALQNSQ